MERIKEHRIIDGVECRQCSTCKEWLPANEKNFLQNYRIYDGLSYNCRLCQAEYRAEYRDNHKAEARDYQFNNKNRINELMINRKTNNPEKYKEKEKDKYLKRKATIAIKRAEDPEYDTEYRKKQNEKRKLYCKTESQKEYVKRYNKTEKGKQVQIESRRKRSIKYREIHKDKTREVRIGYMGKRSRGKWDKWRKKVLFRDKNKCQCCGVKENLQAHHLYSRNNNPELKKQLDNGITLCNNCHVSFHKEYGFGNNTLKQFNYFMESNGNVFGKIVIQLALM